MNEKFLIAIENFKKKNYEKTIEICRDLVKSNNFSEIYNLYGLALQKKKKFKESIKKFNKAADIDQNNFEVFNNLAISYKYENELSLSEINYLKCLKINPNYLQGLVNFALLKESKNQIQESLDLLLKAIKIYPNPHIPFILTKLTIMHLHLGKYEDAKFYANKAIEINPNDIHAYLTLSELTNHKLDRYIINKMNEMINSPKITEIGSIMLSFALGKAYEYIDDFDQAFKSFEFGNNLKKKNTKSNLNDVVNFKNQIINIFKKINLYKINKKTSRKKVIFIVGMPRSGSTLVEQIISSHNKVLGTAENGALMSVLLKEFFQDQKGSLPASLIKKDLLNNQNIIQSNYFKMLSDRNFNSEVYTDKSLENFLFLGFIKIYFPNAKIIILERDIKNVYWSIYKTNFVASFMNWTYDFKEINKYYKNYLEIINFWKALIPKDIYTVKYEKLVDDPIVEIKSLINFCGLKWDPNCLNHQNNKSGIQSASMFQARRPIYKNSKNTIERYLPYLNDIFKSLKHDN